MSPIRSDSAPATAVLSAPPAPLARPTMPIARLNRPPPLRDVGHHQRHHDPEHRGTDAVQHLVGHHHLRAAVGGEQQGAHRQHGEADQQHQPPAAQLGIPPQPGRQQGREQLRHHDPGTHQQVAAVQAHLRQHRRGSPAASGRATGRSCARARRRRWAAAPHCRAGTASRRRRRSAAPGRGKPAAPASAGWCAGAPEWPRRGDVRSCAISMSAVRMRAMASRHGRPHSAASQNTARNDTQAPTSPMMPAARAEPMAAKRTLRPSRSPSFSWRDSASVRAAMAGVSTAAATPCSTCAA